MGNSSSTTAGAPRFGAKSTGDEVSAAFPDAAKGKTFLITGAAGGLGFETARVLAANGAAEVVVSARSQAKCDEAVKKLKAAVPSGTFSTLVVDISSLASVRAASETFLASGKPLHALINNAGIMACPWAKTADGFESQFGTNHIGHFALTQGLLPALQRSSPSRVITLSSVAHWYFTPDAGIPFDEVAIRGAAAAPKDYGFWRNYGISKFSNLLHAAEFDRRYGGGDASSSSSSSPVRAVSVHPGVIMETDLMRSVGAGAMLNFASHWRAITNPESQKNTKQGVATSVLAALAPFEGTPGAESAPFALRGGAYYADCNLVPASGRIHPKASDAAHAKQLWEVSERMLAEVK